MQARGAVSVVVGFYAIGVPLLFILGFMLHMGIVGFWLGLDIAIAFVCVLFFIMSNCLNWSVKADKVQAVMGNAGDSVIFDRSSYINPETTRNLAIKLFYEANIF
ncbi:unnamed protein product [Dibothriocephalus latus]|uniref:Uncharacterized protein n=1 Tax=Dibothriocephalus latus TaxID=60516 RepID=A0A3P6P0K7_DIBLA|nr:unnamed protein product [Dibothriocephalus latus]